jgi:hypothetical protein
MRLRLGKVQGLDKNERNNNESIKKVLAILRH